MRKIQRKTGRWRGSARLAAAACLVWALPGAAACAPDPTGSYVVAVSESTYARPEWRAVAESLRDKYSGRILRYAGVPEDLLLDLQEQPPAYVCFVATPEEAGRDLTITAHRMLRRLDSDPYTDALWGILTGYEAADALRIAQRAEPLVVERGLSATGPFGAGMFKEGRKYCESHRGEVELKERGREARREECSTDNTEGIVQALTEGRAQFFVTSGHATARDWQMGYGKPNGQLRCRDGRLVAIDTQGREQVFEAPEPKVYIAPGNCLIGDIPQRDSMATAWIHSGGVHQMVGYTVSTWYGDMGWGAAMYLTAPQGAYTLSEAFFLNQQALLRRLQVEHPEFAGVDFGDYGIERNHNLPHMLAHRNGLLAHTNDFPRDLVGLLWDRDVVAFYGDPAWQARIPASEPPWREEVAVDGTRYTVRLTALRDGTWPKRPVGVFFPHRVERVGDITCDACDPVVDDLFVLFPLEGEMKAGAVVEASFEGRPLPGIHPEVAADRREMEETLPLVPGSYRAAVRTALGRAGLNRRELIGALKDAGPEQREGIAFLVANMPTSDLRTLSSEFLTGNAAYAYRAWREAPWSASVSKDQFLQYILPYAHLNERRDAWRKDFFDRYARRAWAAGGPADAVKVLNDSLFEELGVAYHATKRPKPDQSPYETTGAGYASCTGLSILLGDVCRAVGVPARIAGVPSWTDQSGNHTWVEIFDGRWYNVGSSGRDPRDPDWVNQRCLTGCDPDRPRHAVYAAVTRATGTSFPLAWDWSIKDVPALNITKFYTEPKPATVVVPGGGEGLVKVWWNGELVARASGRDEVEVTLAGGESYDVAVEVGGQVHRSRLDL